MVSKIFESDLNNNEDILILNFNICSLQIHLYELHQ